MAKNTDKANLEGNTFFTGLDVAPTNPTPKKGKKKEKPQVEIMGLSELSAIRHLKTMLEGLETAYESEVKEQIRNHFIYTGSKEGKRPDNFKGIAADADASCELRKRSTKSVLSDAEVDMLKKHGISFDITTDVVTTYLINPDYAKNAELMGKLDKALRNVESVPGDLFIKQVGKPIRTVTDETMNEIFDVEVSQAERDRLFDAVTVLATKCKYNNTSKAAVDLILPHLGLAEKKAKK